MLICMCVFGCEQHYAQVEAFPPSDEAFPPSDEILLDVSIPYLV